MNSTCLPDDELERLHAGDLDESRTAAARDHLETCPDCKKRNQALHARHEEVLGHLRAAQADRAPGANPNPNEASELNDVPPSLHIEGYEVTRALSRGGQGVVYQALQSGTNRTVAIKVLREGAFASPSAQRRFDREIELVAGLKHPSIVAVFHSGRTVDGQAFCAMDYVQGVPLNQYVREKKLPLEEALKLFAQVCDAVQYAHQKGVIHRDLKPSNILVDAEGSPRLLDFGLAKQLGGEERSLVSQTGQIVGTVPYMSPEQAHGDPNEVDTSTDVYALGVLFYELLTGGFPYPVSGPMAEVLKHIAESTPQPPSRAWSPESGITRRAFGARRRSRAGQCPIDDEVQTIVLKALSKERTRRYQSAAEIARDIRHYLAGEPIEAKRDSGWYVLRLTLRRHRVAVAVAASFVFLLTGSTVTATTLWQRAVGAEAEQRKLTESESKAKDAAEASARAEKRRAEELKQVAEFQGGMLSQLDPTTAGVRLTEDVNRRYAAAMEKLDMPAEERKRDTETFREQWLRVNATDAALMLIDSTILKPAIETIDAEFKNQPVVDAQLRQVLSDRYRELGLFDQAVQVQQVALEKRRRVLGEEHPDTIISIDRMGDLLRNQSKLAEAEPYIREALEKSRRVLGKEDPITFSAISNMASLLADQGKLSEAETYFREVLEGRRRVLGGEHPETLIALGSLGYVLRDEGKFDEAEPYFLEALEKSRRVLGEEHRNTLLALNNVASLLQSQGKLPKAEPYFREALEKSRRVLGEEHPNTLLSIGNLGLLLWDRGKFSEAEPLLRESLEISRRVRGNDHVDTISSISNLGLVIEAEGRFDEAEPYFREALEKCRRVLGEEHPDTLRAIGSMGSLLSAQGKRAEAELYYREALEKRRRVLGEEHPSTLISMSNLGFLLQQEGKFEEAEQYSREVLEKHRRVLGEEHPSTLVSLNNMGSLLQAEGKLSEAEPYYRESLDKARRVLGEDHPTTIRFASTMGYLLFSARKVGEAETYIREVLEKNRRVLGEEHPDTLISINNLASLLLVLGRLDNAEPLYREAMEKGRRLLGEEHPTTVIFTFNLGRILQKQGRYQQAIDLLDPLEAVGRRVFRAGNDDRLATLLAALGLARIGLPYDAERFAAAQANLTEAEGIYASVPGPKGADVGDCLKGLVDLYDTWDKAEPGQGYGAKCAAWKTRLAELLASTQPATSEPASPDR